MCPESRVKKGKENWGCENKVRICKIVQRTHSTQSGERVRPATFSRKMRRARVSERTRMNENLSFTIHNCINHMCRVGRRLHIFCVPSHKRIIIPLFVQLHVFHARSLSSIQPLWVSRCWCVIWNWKTFR